MLHAIKKKLKCRGQPLYDDFSSTTLVSENQTLSVPNLYHDSQAEGGVPKQEILGRIKPRGWSRRCNESHKTH